MSVNYAVRQEKNSPLASDFAREFVARQFGQQAADQIYAALPKYQRGPSKGQPKGWVLWTKCLKGGWVRKGPYDHDAQRASGYVMAPGTHDIRIMLVHPAYAQDKTYTLDAGDRRSNETDEQWATRCGRAIYQMQGKPVPEALAEPQPAVEDLCHPKAATPKEIVADAFMHWYRGLVTDGTVGNISIEGTPEEAAGKIFAYLLTELS